MVYVLFEVRTVCSRRLSPSFQVVNLLYFCLGPVGESVSVFFSILKKYLMTIISCVDPLSRADFVRGCATAYSSALVFYIRLYLRGTQAIDTLVDIMNEAPIVARD